MEVKSSETTASSSLAKSASHSSWNVDFFIGSGSGSSSTSKSDSSQSFEASKMDIKIGFQATKVTLNRGGWFSPQVFRNSDQYMKVQGGIISSGPPENMKVDADLVRQYATQLFPAYPVSFVIVRDVTIQLTTSFTVSKSSKDYLHKESSSSGGFLCFSYSSSSSSTKQHSSFHSIVRGDTISIKIPGSQIIGWYLQFVPKDNAGQYESMPPNYWPQIESPSPRPSKAAK